MMTRIEPKIGHIVFVVEKNNTYIGQVNKLEDEPYDGKVVEIIPIYFKDKKVNTTSMWTEPKNIKAFLGDDLERAKIEYAEYFV